MDWLGTFGVALGTAWLSGMKLYGSVLTLGLLQHFGFANLPGDLRILGDWWVIAITGLLFVLEFVADKIPAVDTAWDAVHTFIRIPAGAILAAAAFAHFDSRVRLLALLLGGGVALASHGTKAAARIAVNASPEPVSNILLSLFEDAGSVGLSLLVARHPFITLVVVVILVIAGALMIRRIVRGIRSLFPFRRGV